MLTLKQKVAVRRHLGVPFAGTAQAGRLYGWRFTWYNEDLEYRMNNMQPPEEQMLTGVSLGSFRIDGRPTVGDVLTFNLNDGTNRTANYTVQASDFTMPMNSLNPSMSSPLYSIALNSALAVNQQMASAGYAAVGVMPSDAMAPAFLPPYFAEVEILGPTTNTFTLTCSKTGTTNLLVSDAGSPCPVRTSLSDPVTATPTALYGYLAILDVLSMGMTQADLSLAYQTADVVTFRPDEVKARRALYKEYCIQMEMVLGGKDYVDKFSGGGGGAVA